MRSSYEFSFRYILQGSGQVTSSRSSVPLLLICFKLTAIMGLTWILTLVANWEQASFLQYPATVLNSLQGKWYACRFLEGSWFDFEEARKKGNQSPFISSIQRPYSEDNALLKVICSVTLKRWYHSVDNIWLSLLINSCFQQFHSSFMTKMDHSLSVKTRMKQKRFPQWILANYRVSAFSATF